jgi:hypothetical protein
MHDINKILLLLASGLLAACGGDAPGDSADAVTEPMAAAPAAADASSVSASEGELPELTIDDSTVKCLDDMTRVRHFYVDNLLGDVEATVAVAESTDGGTFPPGSVVSLVPSEVMIKHRPGWNPGTRDWEFFELDVSAEGSSIRNRGFADVVNQFGGNCLACHIRAEAKYDLICERDHGCDPIPVTREQIAAAQEQDPRCVE